MNKSIDEARKLMSPQKPSERCGNKVLTIKTHAAISAAAAGRPGCARLAKLDAHKSGAVYVDAP